MGQFCGMADEREEEVEEVVVPEDVYAEVAVETVGVEVEFVDAYAGVAYELYIRIYRHIDQISNRLVFDKNEKREGKQWTGGGQGRCGAPQGQSATRSYSSMKWMRIQSMDCIGRRHERCEIIIEHTKSSLSSLSLNISPTSLTFCKLPKSHSTNSTSASPGAPPSDSDAKDSFI